MAESSATVLDKGKGKALLTPDPSPTKPQPAPPEDERCSRSSTRESTVDSLYSQASQNGSTRARFRAALLAARNYVMPFGKHGWLQCRDAWQMADG